MATKSSTPTSGSLNWSTAANWSDLAVPASSDTATLGPGTATVDSGLAQQAVTLTNFNVPASFSGQIGTAAQTVKSVSGITRTSGTATATSTAHGYSNGDTVVISGADQSDYNIAAVISNVATDTFDYTVANTPTTPATGTILVQKAEELHIGATNFRIGNTAGLAASNSGGSARAKINFGTVQTTGVCEKTGTSADTGKEPLRVRGTHASNKFYVQGGTVGFSTNRPGEAGTWSEISVTGQAATANVGSGVTLTTFRQTNGFANVNCAFTTLHQDGGTFTSIGSGAITTANVGGIAYLNSTGTITNLNVNNGGTADLTQNQQARTVTNITLTKGSTLKYDPAVVTVTNPITLSGCTLKDVSILIPQGATVSIVAT
jgi:hypothetical protein